VIQKPDGHSPKSFVSHHLVWQQDRTSKQHLLQNIEGDPAINDLAFFSATSIYHSGICQN